MTKQLNYPLVEIGKQLAEKCIKEEKEKFAIGFSGKNKPFGTVDLWNIERQRKTRGQKRMLSLVNL
ncbi:MAG: hypothetical protein ABIS01_09505 [Ferruginibacter sp.]